MTKTETTTVRYYVARSEDTIERLASKPAAVAHANALYDRGVVAPLVVAATDRQAAMDKARRCYRGEITSRQAARP